MKDDYMKNKIKILKVIYSIIGVAYSVGCLALLIAYLLIIRGLLLAIVQGSIVDIFLSAMSTSFFSMLVTAAFSAMAYFVKR